MAAAMRELLDTELRSCVVVPIPTSRQRVRQRGFDHALIMARHIAYGEDLVYQEYLRRKGSTRQVGATRRQRQQQMKYSLSVHGDVQGKDIVLIDDVTSTGATLEAAATVLKEAGARKVSALIFARA